MTTPPVPTDGLALPRAAVRAGEKSGSLPVALVSFTIFLGAFLLFLIEPLFAKLILPSFGGSAAVWATCLVFFQSALLLGYFYADVATRRLTPPRQSMLHIVLLLACLLFLPVMPRLGASSDADPSWRILLLLMASIGLPFVVLSTTSILLQAWYTRDRAGVEPYHFFALSNLASLLALLSFPFLIEPRISSHNQALLWSCLFGLFVVTCTLLAWLARGPYGEPLATAANAKASETIPAPSSGQKILWVSLSACGAMLLLSVTNHLLENVAPVPLLWVLPLALYLLTFTLAFHRPSLYWRWLIVRALALALGTLGYAIYDPSFTESVQVSVPLFCAGLFLCCLFYHGELARRRPPARYLTSFYLMISLGGAIGAIFVGLLAPHIFSAIYEFPLTLFLTAVLAIAALWPQGWPVRVFWAVAAIALAFVLVRNARLYEKNTTVMVRNFYGALRVKEFQDWLKQPYRTLYHGRIEHGAQYLNPPQSLRPTTYYAKESGIGLALDRCCKGPKRVGAIGLGAGTLTAYGKEGDYFRFYEINPLVPLIAKSSFHFLRDTAAKVDIVLGDARLSLGNEPPQGFDVIAVDAFSGDAIPVHLLTKEAFALYLRHLKPGGILAIHTSNTYLDLAPVVQLLANDAGYLARWISSDDNRRELVDSSDWVLVSRNRQRLDDLDSSVFIEPIPVPPHLRLWTDDYNNLFQVLRPAKFLERDVN